jgi:hypothetical protein
MSALPSFHIYRQLGTADVRFLTPAVRLVDTPRAPALGATRRSLLRAGAHGSDVIALIRPPKQNPRDMTLPLASDRAAGARMSWRHRPEEAAGGRL